MSRQVRSYTLAPRTMSEVTVLVGRVEERDLRRRAESFNDWGAGIRRFRHRGGHQNTLSGDRTVSSSSKSHALAWYTTL